MSDISIVSVVNSLCVWVSFQHCHLTSVYDYLVLEKCKIPRRGSALCLITAVTQPSVAQKVILSARLSVILILVLFANSELGLSVWRTSRGVPHSWPMSMHVQLCIISTGYLRFRQQIFIYVPNLYLYLYEARHWKRTVGPWWMQEMVRRGVIALALLRPRPHPTPALSLVSTVAIILIA